ncbi:formate dehydrogenase subunit gamma [Thermodesulfobacteriota bacterium]
MSKTMIKRHSKASIFMHWFNTICWFFLLATGLGLIKNDKLDPIGGWWPDMMRIVFNGGENLLLAHVICGFLWVAVFLVFSIIRLNKEVVFFFKEIFSFSPVNDLMWVIKKGIQMTMGYKMLKRLGLEPRIPEQGFYNVGQKLFAILAILGGIVIAATGIVMYSSKFIMMDTGIVQWSILIHFVLAGIVFAGLLIHIYMASMAAGELPALISMFTGTVPGEYAEHHHKLWYDRIKE